MCPLLSCEQAEASGDARRLQSAMFRPLRLTFIPVLYVTGLNTCTSPMHRHQGANAEPKVIYGMLLWCFTDWCLTSRILILHLGSLQSTWSFLLVHEMLPTIQTEKMARGAEVKPSLVRILGHEGTYVARGAGGEEGMEDQLERLDGVVLFSMSATFAWRRPVNRGYEPMWTSCRCSGKLFSRPPRFSDSLLRCNIGVGIVTNNILYNYTTILITKVFIATVCCVADKAPRAARGPQGAGLAACAASGLLKKALTGLSGPPWSFYACFGLNPG